MCQVCARSKMSGMPPTGHSSCNRRRSLGAPISRLAVLFFGPRFGVQCDAVKTERSLGGLGTRITGRMLGSGVRRRLLLLEQIAPEVLGVGAEDQGRFGVDAVPGAAVHFVFELQRRPLGAA
jgi:hypothetical protein